MKNVFKFDFSNLKGDFLGGLTAGIVALPLALAFGEQTELGAIAGLYGAIAIGVLAALFGGTPTQISGPTAPMTVVSALIITDAVIYMNGDLSLAMPIIIATFVAAGLIEILFGVFKLGTYIKYIPYPVISGFMSGIGVIIVITQIFPFIGAAAPSGGPLGTITAIHKIPEIINYTSIGITLVTILIIYFFPRLTKVIPSALAALLLVSIAAYFLPLEDFLQLDSKGAIPTDLPSLQLNFISVFLDMNNLSKVLEYAFTLAALGAIDSLLTSVVADNITKTKHDSDQELIGQGIGNIGAALIGGLPGAGATMRTVINANTGGKTKISGVIAGLFLLVVLLGIGSLVGNIPNAVLAGILITVGIGIIDYKGIRHFRDMPRADQIVLVLVFVLTVFVDLLIAVAAGMVLSSLLFMKKAAEMSEKGVDTAPLSDFAREVPWSDEGDIIKRIGQKVYIKHLNGPLFFGFAARFNEMVKALPKIEVVIIRMDRVPYMDQSGLYSVEDAIQDMHDLDVAVVFVGVHGQPKDMLESIAIIPNLVSKEYCFNTFSDCATWLEDYLNGEKSIAKMAENQKDNKTKTL
jgi:SulP family sulfate permease